MNDPGNPLARALNLGVLAGAWLIVPGDGREEWWREWRGECQRGIPYQPESAAEPARQGGLDINDRVHG